MTTKKLLHSEYCVINIHNHVENLIFELAEDDSPLADSIKQDTIHGSQRKKDYVNTHYRKLNLDIAQAVYSKLMHFDKGVKS